MAERDILIADFEGPTYGDWTVAGEAFGRRPARANVSPGNKVTGHWGQGLVNSVDQIFQSDEPRRPADPGFTRAVSGDRTSRVPQFTFADTLEEQEAQMEDQSAAAADAAVAEGPGRRSPPADLPLRQSGRVAERSQRAVLLAGTVASVLPGVPAGRPAAALGPRGQRRPDPLARPALAIYPNPEEKCYSGATLVEKDRVIAMYHGTRVGNMVAVSRDPLLLNWQKVTGQAVIPITSPDGSPLPYRVFDPCIWKKGDLYYSLSGGTLPGPGGRPVRANFLFRSQDLAKWEYLHPFAENDRFSLVGDDGACPYFWPIGDRHILLHFSHMSGGKYLLGDYDTERDKFVVTSGGDFNFGPARRRASTHPPPRPTTKAESS